MQVVSGLGITSDQFVDVCILCGCDYAGTIRGIGAVRALQLVQKHGAPHTWGFVPVRHHVSQRHGRQQCC